MKPIRITRLAPGEWIWNCYWCHAFGITDRQPAALVLSHAHYILAHWPPKPRTEPTAYELVETIHAGRQR